MSETLAYLAGIVDGEGCITITRYRRKDGAEVYRPTFTVSMVGSEPVEALAREFGLNVRTRTKFPYSPQALVYVTGQKAGNVLRVLYPYLRVKKTQAGLALMFLDIQREWSRRNPSLFRSAKEYLYREIRQRNKRANAIR